jgi:hypothetical protein
MSERDRNEIHRRSLVASYIKYQNKEASNEEVFKAYFQVRIRTAFVFKNISRFDVLKLMT